MKKIISIIISFVVLARCHNIVKRDYDEIDGESYDFENGMIPHYPEVHYNDAGELEFFPRIIGGEPSWHGEFPAKISIQTRAGNHFCGGALIDLRHVLTAAHCLTTTFGAVFNPDSIRLMGDDVSIQRWGSPTRQMRFASHIFVHPSFNPWTYDADLSVVRVSVPYTQSPTLRFVPRSLSTPFDNMVCQLAGWGLTSEEATRPHPILLRVDLEIVSLQFCNGTESFRGSIPIGFLCAGSVFGGRDACQGDSGGALICNSQIAGIVSFGFGCGRRNFPGAYVDVSQWNHWIQECIASTLPHDEIPRPSPRPDPNSVASLVSTKIIVILALVIKLFTH